MLQGLQLLRAVTAGPGGDPELQAAAAAVMAGVEPRESESADLPVPVDQAGEFQLPAEADDTMDDSVAAQTQSEQTTVPRAKSPVRKSARNRE